MEIVLGASVVILASLSAGFFIALGGDEDEKGSSWPPSVSAFTLQRGWQRVMDIWSLDFSLMSLPQLS